MMYPIIKGDQIFFSEDVCRDLKPFEIPATHNEFSQLTNKYGQGIVFIPESTPENPDAGKVAVSGEDQIYRHPLRTINVKQYDNIISQLGEVEKILEAHRKETSEK